MPMGAWGATMKLLRRIIFVFAVSLALTSHGAIKSVAQEAPSPEALQAARDLTAIVSVDMISELSQRLTNQVWPSIEATLRARAPNITPAALVELRREFE